MPDALTSWLSAVQARLFKATPGPWEWHRMNSHLLCCHSNYFSTDPDVIAVQQCHEHDADLAIKEADADFISHASSDLAQALALLTVLREVAEVANDILRNGVHVTGYTESGSILIHPQTLQDALARYQAVVRGMEETDG